MAELPIVDDDPAIRRMLGRTLAAEGYEVRVAADGGAALAELERSLPDVLVLDVTMPDIDGLYVAERVRAKGLQLPILFLTARDAVSDRVAGFEAGGDDYLVKPFAAAELLVRVRALLRRTREPDRELVHRDLRLDPSARRAVRKQKAPSAASKPRPGSRRTAFSGRRHAGRSGAHLTGNPEAAHE